MISFFFNPYLVLFFSYSDKPRYLQKPSKTIGVQGSTVNLECQAEGNPPPNITWTKDGSAIASSIKHRVNDHGTLVIEKFSEEAVGFYQCNIENVIGKESAGAALLLVDENGEFFFQILRQTSFRRNVEIKW